MGTTSSSPATFTGSSAFSSSLAQVITQAVQIASLPMQQLQSQQSTDQSQQSELGTLSSDFTSLGNAISSIDNATGSSSYSASVANSSILTATTGSGVMAGTYTVDISALGSNSTAISNTGLTTVTDPTKGNIAAGTAFTLTVNNQAYTLTDSGSSLDGLVNAINSSGAGVQATIVNVGSSSSPNYQLSLQSQHYAPDTIALTNSNGNPLVNQPVTGAYVQYQVNGEPSTPINSNTRTLAISPGLTVNAVGTGTTTVTVSQTGSSIANVLTSFVSAYNAAAADVAKNRGQSGGALTGDPIVFSLSNSLQQLGNFSLPSGTVQSMADIGLAFDPDTGNLDFNATTFNQAVSTNMQDVLNFLGSATANTGFFGAANAIMTSINDPTAGMLPQATANIATEISGLGNTISDDQNKISVLQANLTEQMSTADAAIASLEQQASYLQSMQETENANAQLGF